MVARHDAVVTLWFITAAEPARTLRAEPKADRGYGRKYLAHLNPAWPITPIGQFDLNRSVPASPGEFYVGGYPGVAIVQTVINNAHQLSELDARLLTSIPATDVYALAANPSTGLGGIAHWRGGTLKRSFCARRNRVYEDIGFPEDFEHCYWNSDDDAPEVGSNNLPFNPIDLVDTAQQEWIGVPVSPDGPDINIVAYAIDGRPEPKVVDNPKQRNIGDLVAAASNKLGFNPATRDYDDYEDGELEDPNPLNRIAQRGLRVLGSARDTTRIRFREFGSSLHEKIRHTDRDPNQPRTQRLPRRLRRRGNNPEYLGDYPEEDFSEEIETTDTEILEVAEITEGISDHISDQADILAYEPIEDFPEDSDDPHERKRS